MPQTTGKSIVGPALTLQFLPQRPDLFSEGEYADPETQLHRHVLYHVQEGDVVVVDARGDMRSGIFGDMMSTYFKGRGGAGIVIDGCMRDRPNVEKLDLALWLKGWTPNYHVQTDIYPNAVNVHDRLRRRHGHARRHHRRRRRRRGGGAGLDGRDRSSRTARSTPSGKSSRARS